MAVGLPPANNILTFSILTFSMIWPIRGVVYL